MPGATLKTLRRSWAPFALFAVMVVGGALRFYGLTIQSLWSDELASWYFSQRDTLSGVIEGARSDIHPPGYFLTLHFSQMLFGEAEWALRLPSAIAGWLCIPAIYLLGRRIYSDREGVIAALLVAVLWAPIYFSQETRSYSMLILFSIVTTYLWWGVMEGLRDRRRLPTVEAVAYVVVAVICAYLHYFGALLVGLQGFALAGLAYRSFPKVALLYAPIALSYVFWLPSMVYQTRFSARYGAWIEEPTLSVVPDYMEFLFVRSVGISLVAWALLALLLLRLFWNVFGHYDRGEVLSTGLLFAWFLVPLVLAYAVSLYSVNLLTHKNLLVSLPAVYLLISRSITLNLSGGPVGALLQGAAALGLAGVCLASMLFSMQYYDKPNKEQIREAAAYMADRGTPATLLVRCDVDARLDYYLDQPGIDEKTDVNACEAKDFPKVEDRIREGNYGRVYYLMSHKEPTPGLVSRLRNELAPVRFRPFYGTWVATFRVKEPGRASLGETDRG